MNNEDEESDHTSEGDGDACGSDDSEIEIPGSEMALLDDAVIIDLTGNNPNPQPIGLDAPHQPYAIEAEQASMPKISNKRWAVLSGCPSSSSDGDEAEDPNEVSDGTEATEGTDGLTRRGDRPSTEKR
ncbi:hypothetical protein N7508_002449 [Penicillium antarcticum]|uniref:uncharacterized protein n=1 Tax=Penicillium antarcticum TaxID=416450 RepID=UPI002385BFB9|nr:uncharacterized protein N7508_002449 [Penicillium antarcticum]KAJ5317941.1 hypothetical protein N7508_002449 [Penicillium antarcticum]